MGLAKVTWPFDGPMHLLLNIAFGGNWGGAKGVNDAILPAKMEIDYVRVYQLKVKTMRLIMMRIILHQTITDLSVMPSPL